MLRPAIQADLLIFGASFETELGSDHYFFTERSERFACEFFVRERTVHFSGIEKRHTLFKCRSNQRNHLLLVLGRTVAKLIPMQPSPMAETSRLLLPSLRFCILKN